MGGRGFRSIAGQSSPSSSDRAGRPGSLIAEPSGGPRRRPAELSEGDGLVRPDRGAATNHRPAGSGRAARALGTSTMVRVAPPLQPMLAATPGVPRPKRGPDLRLDLWAHEDFNLGPLPCQESPGLGRSADQRAKRGSPGMDVGPIHEKWGPFVLRVRPFGCLTALCAVNIHSSPGGLSSIVPHASMMRASPPAE